jgi:hypothetical protein
LLARPPSFKNESATRDGRKADGRRVVEADGTEIAAMRCLSLNEIPLPLDQDQYSSHALLHAEIECATEQTSTSDFCL